MSLDKVGVDNWIRPEISSLDIVPNREIPLEKRHPDSQIGYHKKHLTWFEKNIAQHASFHRGPRSRSARARMLWSAAAASIDILILFALMCFTLLGFYLLQPQFLSPTITWLQHELVGANAYYAALISANLFAFFYLSFTRIYLGFSFGEWACFLRLGNTFQRQSDHYSWLVVKRNLLLLATGYILLPLFSLVFKTDIAGLISGVAVTDSN